MNLLISEKSISLTDPGALKEVTAYLAIESLFIPETSIDIKYPSGQSDVPEGSRDQINEFLLRTRSASVDDRSVRGLEKSLVELLVNANVHGNHKNPNKIIGINCGWIQFGARDAFVASVTDEGVGFDLNADHIIGNPAEGGIGLDIAKDNFDLLWNSGSTVYGIRVF